MPTLVQSESELYNIDSTDHIILQDSITITKDDPICVNFAGILDGNGYTITGLTTPLFNQLLGCEITDLTVSEINIHPNSEKERTGGICRESQNSELTNVTISDSEFQTKNESILGSFIGTSRNDVLIDCTVEKTKLINGDTIGGDDKIGGLVGKGYKNTIKGCTVDCVIKQGNITGGVCGYISKRSTVKNCEVSGEISGETSVGGIVGINHLSVIKNCVNRSSVHGKTAVGGISGRLTGDSIYVQNYGYVTGEDKIGGIAGINNSKTTKYTINKGYVSGENCVGGVFGASKMPISHAKNVEDVSGERKVGGIVGDLDANLSKSYSISDVSGDDCVGGLVGKLDSIANLKFKNLYYIGEIDGLTFSNPIIGNKDNVDFQSNHIYWDSSHSTTNTSTIGTKQELTQSHIATLLGL